MPRLNLDRIRELLILAENVSEADAFVAGAVDISDELMDGDEYQLVLMRDAGWIDASDPTTGFFRVTYIGHEYLEAVRDKGIWQETRAAIASAGGGATLNIAMALAIGFLKKKISQHTGADL